MTRHGRRPRRLLSSGPGFPSSHTWPSDPVSIFHYCGLSVGSPGGAGLPPSSAPEQAADDQPWTQFKSEFAAWSPHPHCRGWVVGTVWALTAALMSCFCILNLVLRLSTLSGNVFCPHSRARSFLGQWAFLIEVKSSLQDTNDGDPYSGDALVPVPQ